MSEVASRELVATIRRECCGACGKGRTSPSLSTADPSRFSPRFDDFAALDGAANLTIIRV
jgi:hypothetical protein